MVEDSVDLKERILVTTEILLRRYGATKLSVVDVAREIGMSHGNIYRFFSSKSVLLTAIAERWMCKVQQPLAEITASDKPADQKLVNWLTELRNIKRQKYLGDPQLFAIYGEVAEQAREEVHKHINEMVDQIETIINEGNESKIFHCQSPRLAARAILDATAKLHHPAFVGAIDYPTDDEARYLIQFAVDALKYDGK